MADYSKQQPIVREYSAGGDVTTRPLTVCPLVVTSSEEQVWKLAHTMIQDELVEGVDPWVLDNSLGTRRGGRLRKKELLESAGCHRFLFFGPNGDWSVYMMRVGRDGERTLTADTSTSATYVFTQCQQLAQQALSFLTPPGRDSPNRPLHAIAYSTPSKGTGIHDTHSYAGRRDFSKGGASGEADENDDDEDEDVDDDWAQLRVTVTRGPCRPGATGGLGATGANLGGGGGDGGVGRRRLQHPLLPSLARDTSGTVRGLPNVNRADCFASSVLVMVFNLPDVVGTSFSIAINHYINCMGNVNNLDDAAKGKVKLARSLLAVDKAYFQDSVQELREAYSAYMHELRTNAGYPQFDRRPAGVVEVRVSQEDANEFFHLVIMDIIESETSAYQDFCSFRIGKKFVCNGRDDNVDLTVEKCNNRTERIDVEYDRRRSPVQGPGHSPRDCACTTQWKH